MSLWASLFGVPSDPLSGALSDPLFGAPSEPPTAPDLSLHLGKALKKKHASIEEYGLELSMVAPWSKEPNEVFHCTPMKKGKGPKIATPGKT